MDFERCENCSDFDGCYESGCCKKSLYDGPLFCPPEFDEDALEIADDFVSSNPDCDED